MFHRQADSVSHRFGTRPPAVMIIVNTPASGRVSSSAVLSSRGDFRYSPHESVEYRASQLAAVV